MKAHKRRSNRSTRSKLYSPGRPPVWQRETLCRFWQAVASGQTSEDAAVNAGVSAPVGARWFRNSGGMPATHLGPSAKPPSGRYLTFLEREDIAIELAKGAGVRAIARKIGRSASTISRELRRNAATRSGNLDYRASTAQWHADRAFQRPRPSKFVTNPALRDYVQARLAGTSRLHIGSDSISPRIRPCASAMRPFTKRYIFKAVAHYVATLPPVYGLGGLCVCLANGSEIAASPSLPMR